MTVGQGGALMDRYFFDVVGNEGPTLDYSGRMLRTTDEAYDWGEYDFGASLSCATFSRAKARLR